MASLGTPDMQRFVALEAELAALRVHTARERRALEALYRVSRDSRGSASFEQVFAVSVRELHTVFAFDSCYIALRHETDDTTFRAVLLDDEGVTEYKENVDISPLTGSVVANRMPVIIDDLFSEPQRRATPFGNTQKRSRSWMGVPLLVGQSAIGVLALQCYEVACFDSADVDMLQWLGNIIAVSIENADLAQQQSILSHVLARQVEERTSELATLSAVSAELVRQQSLAALMARALARVVPLFKLDGAVIRLLDDTTNNLVVAAHFGLPEEYTRDAARLPIEGTTVGEVMRNNEPVLISQGMRDRSTIPLVFDSLLCVPLRIGTQVLGTVSLLGLDAHEFTSHELDLAQAMANQIAIAIENARLFANQHRQIGELQALTAINRAATTARDLPTLLRMIYDALQTFMQLDAFSMVVYDQSLGIVIDGISIDEGEEYSYWKNEPLPSGSFSAWIIRNRQPLLFENVDEEIANHPQFGSHLVGSNRAAMSWLGVPLVNRTATAIGALAVQSYSAGVFTLRDQQFLTTVASQVVLHIENVRLLTQRERQIRELDAIGQIGRMVAASFDLNEMLQLVYELLAHTVDATAFFLMLCEPRTRIMTHVLAFANGRRVATTLVGDRPPSGGLADWILSQREPLLYSDLKSQTNTIHAQGIRPAPLVESVEVRSWVGVPLVAQAGDVIGVLSLQNAAPYRYDEQTIDFLLQIAGHISLGVQKVWLFAERERQVRENARLAEEAEAARRTADTLREVARVLSSTFNSQEVLALILRELHNVIAYDAASIMLLEGDMLRFVAYQGPNGNRIPEFPIDKPSGAWLVVRSRAPHVIDDVRLSSDWMPNEAASVTRAWVGVPLIVKNQVLGVLNIDSLVPGHFSQRDVDAAQAFADQAAISLENARLYQESVTRVEKELDIARHIQRNLFPRSLPHIPSVDVAARCIPAHETGGDFFDLIPLDEHDDQGVTSVGLVVGDASGKSIPAAMLMAIAHSVVRSEARDHRHPDRVICETNTLLARDVPERSFVALSYATLDVPSRHFSLANAGQLTPWLRRADGSVIHLEVPGETFPLGIVARTHYKMLELDLAPGDLLLFVTDGIVEAKNASRELFGFDRLEALIEFYGHEEPAALINTILSEVAVFVGQMPQHDDMTLLALRIS